MCMRRKIFLFICFLLTLLNVSAQDFATSVLDKAASAFQKAGSVKIAYTWSANGQQGKGTIKMKGRKFVNNLGGQIVWFNGKTMWTLVKENEEVNVTTPTAGEVARMNPYAFVNLYKKGYTASKGKSAHDYHEIVLKNKTAQGSLRNIVLHINRFNSQPMSVRIVDKDGNVMDITVRSYEKNQKFADALFTFNPKAYPDYEIVDLR